MFPNDIDAKCNVIDMESGSIIKTVDLNDFSAEYFMDEMENYVPVKVTLH